MGGAGLEDFCSGDRFPLNMKNLVVHNLGDPEWPPSSISDRPVSEALPASLRTRPSGLVISAEVEGGSAPRLSVSGCLSGRDLGVCPKPGLCLWN